MHQKQLLLSPLPLLFCQNECFPLSLLPPSPFQIGQRQNLASTSPTPPPPLALSSTVVASKEFISGTREGPSNFYPEEENCSRHNHPLTTQHTRLTRILRNRQQLLYYCFLLSTRHFLSPCFVKIKKVPSPCLAHGSRAHPVKKFPIILSLFWYSSYCSSVVMNLVVPPLIRYKTFAQGPYSSLPTTITIQSLSS